MPEIPVYFIFALNSVVVLVVSAAAENTCAMILAGVVLGVCAYKISVLAFRGKDK